MKISPFIFSFLIILILVGCGKSPKVDLAPSIPLATQDALLDPYDALPVEVRTLFELKTPTDQEAFEIAKIFSDVDAMAASDFVKLGNTQAIQKVASTVRYSERSPRELAWLAPLFEYADETAQREYSDRVHELIKRDPSSIYTVFSPHLCIAPYSSRIHRDLILSAFDSEAFTASDLKNLSWMVAAKFDKKMHKPFFLRLLEKVGEDSVPSFVHDSYVIDQWKVHYGESPLDYFSADSRKISEQIANEITLTNEYRATPELFLR